MGLRTAGGLPEGSHGPCHRESALKKSMMETMGNMSMRKTMRKPMTKNHDQTTAHESQADTEMNSHESQAPAGNLETLTGTRVFHYMKNRKIWDKMEMKIHGMTFPSILLT